ncbi:MAG: DASH family cryptochrome, partial [Planctomycetota bacterium]
EERELELRVKIILEARGIEWSSKPPSALYDLEQLPFPIDEIPELFTTFRKQVEKRADVAEPLAAPESIPCAKALLNKAQSAGVPLESIACISGNPDASPKQSFTFRGGETAGLGRLTQYLWETDAVATYFDTRNGMLRDLDSTKFSPWLANGCLSPRKVYAEVKQYERQRKKNKSTYWVFFELLWREYFRWIQQKHGASMFHVGGIRSADISWDDDADMFVAWRDGQTGFPIIDANMREIAATGWMSNRGRQNVASFLTKNLGQDWRIGAEWFESLLLDYDPTSNYGNWNYIAGVGNDAREFRWFNPIRQAENYDPKGDYVRHWCPELADVPVHSVHQPWRLDDLDYPEPIVDLHESADSNRRRFDL